MQLQVVSPNEAPKTLAVSDAIFGQTPNVRLLAQAVQIYLSNQRQGTSKVKTRSEINRTKKKWFKQKGTGNARHGARTPNIFVGGGVAHGPEGITDWSRTLSKTMRQKALIYALSAQAKVSAICDAVLELPPKTKAVMQLLKAVATDKKAVLVVVDKPSTDLLRCTANMDEVVVSQASRLHPYEVLLADQILFTTSGLAALEKRLQTEEKQKEVVKPAKKVVVRTPKTEKTSAKKAVKKAV